MSSLSTLYWCANGGCFVEQVPCPLQGQKRVFCFSEIFGKTYTKLGTFTQMVGYFYSIGWVF
jgi:hypothetical protein